MSKRTIRSLITGTGSHLPEKCLTNDDLAKMVDTSNAWIRTRTGIVERRIAAEGETTSDLAVEAGRRAMAAAGIGVDDLDMILVATTTPDLVFPATATIVQRKLGAHRRAIPAFDIQAVCSGFIYGLSVADSFIRGGGAKQVLVIGAETMSRIVDWNDRGTCILFGDGAGAAVLSAGTDTDRGVLTTRLHADGTQEDLLCTAGGVSRGFLEPNPNPLSGCPGAGAVVKMRGNEVFKRAVLALGGVVEEVLEEQGLKKSDLDWLVPHQANIRIIHGTAKRLKMDLERVVMTVDRHGNTSAASVPLALDEAVRDGRIQPGHLVLLEAFGGGFTWGASLIRW